MRRFLYLPLLLLLLGCAAKREAVMPFYNYDFSGDRLFPISLNEADFCFRIWINNGTSIDRIISVSKDTIFGKQAFLIEEGNLLSKQKHTGFYNETKVTPKSGVDGFIKRIDSLNLFEYRNQRDSDFEVSEHTPFSLYIVEIKENNKYHCFKFNTHFPKKETDITKYYGIEKLIFDEFKYNFYMK